VNLFRWFLQQEVRDWVLKKWRFESDFSGDKVQAMAFNLEVAKEQKTSADQAHRRAGILLASPRSLKTEPDGALLASVRDDRFKLPRICVWVYLYDPKIVQVGLRGDLSNVLRLGILDINHIFSSVLKPADQHKVTKGPGLRLWRRLSVFCRRLTRLRNCRRNEGIWIGSRSDFLFRILLHDYSLFACCVSRSVAVIDVRSIGA
jgi:hypothetical protein